MRPSVLLLVALAGASGPVLADLRFVEGEARDLASGQLLYREQHWIRQAGAAPAERLVLYRCPSGTAFARKRVDYRRSATAPEFSLEDVRSDYREGLRRSGAAASVYSGAKTTALPAPTDALVADAGFDEFLRARWDVLTAGRPQPLAFVVPKPGADADDIAAFLRGKLASYKQPARIEFIEAIPKSASGKILRRLLRDRQARV